MASAGRVSLVLSLWFAFGCEVLAGSRTVAVQVTFVDVAQYSATQTVTLSDPAQRGLSSDPQLSADLRQTAYGSKPLNLLVEGARGARDPHGAHACVPGDPVSSGCDGRLAADLIVTISYH